MNFNELTEEERSVLGLMAFKKLEPRREIRKKWTVGRLYLEFHWRSKKNLWGRFGGGWNWNLGIQSGGHTVIINLLVCSLRIGRTTT